MIRATATAAEILALLKKPKAKGRHRHIHGTMNKWERAFEAYLKIRKDVVWYLFEAITFKLAHDTRYTPDFVYMDDQGELTAVDVKGRTKDKKTEQYKPYIEDDAHVKLKVAADKFSPIRWVIAWQITDGMAWQEQEIKVA